MSFLTFVENAGLEPDYNYAGTSVCTLTSPIPTGRFAVVRSACRLENEPADTADGATDYHQTCIDSRGNTYLKLGEATKGSLPSEPGSSVAIFLGTIISPLQVGDTVTVGLDSSRRGRVLDVEHFAAEEDGSTVALVEADIAFGRGGSVEVTLAPTAGAGDYTWLGAGFTSKRDSAGVTPNALYASDLDPTILDHGFDDSGTIWGQYRGYFGDTDTLDATISDISHRWAMVLAAVLVTPPASSPVPGTRQYQDEFETDSFGVVEISTAIRPDALSRSLLLASCDGPVALDDATAGIEGWRWQVTTADGLTVQVRRATDANDDWLPWTDLLTVSGSEPITELSVAFNIDGHIVVAMERPNGTLGAKRVSVWRWDLAIGVNDYTLKQVADGYSPRCLNDLFPFISTAPHICPPEVDVQLFYMAAGVGMVRAQESDDWDVPYPTVVPYHSGRRVETVAKTVDRRVSVILTRHVTSTGLYVMERTDSVPYADAALRRPTFENWSSPASDLMASGGQAWYSPGGSVVAETWNLRVSTPQDIDAIEVQASATYPSGDAPTFPLDNQEVSGGLSAGDIHDFTFDITHGGGTMSHVAFRARTRRVIGLVTCYSPWRYTVIPAAWPSPPSSTPDDYTVNCGHDYVFDLLSRMGWIRHGLVEGIAENLGNNPCPSEPAISATDVPFGYWFVGGELNTGPSYPFPTHFQRYTARRRPWEPINFVDDDGVHLAGTVLGDIVDGFSGSAVTKAFDWPDYRWPRQFPDDTGRFPNIGASLDVLLSS